MIRRRGEHCAGRVGPLLYGRDCQGVFTFEVMEEGAFCHASRLTKVIDAGRRQALPSNNANCGVKQFGAGVGFRDCVHHGDNIPTGWYVSQGFDERIIESFGLLRGTVPEEH